MPWRDHGEICWLKWRIETGDHCLICSTDCNNPRATFTRQLEFKLSSLKWKFDVLNLSRTTFPFLHVMHALMPLTDLKYLEFPSFNSVLEENGPELKGLADAAGLSEYLMNLKSGTFKMLLMKNPGVGSVRYGLKNGIRIDLKYNVSLFPTLGIWWNNGGYPDEEGLRRSEYYEQARRVAGGLGELWRSPADR